MKIKNILRKIVIISAVMIISSFMTTVSAQQGNFYLNHDIGDKFVSYENGQINWSKNLVIAAAREEISLVNQRNFSFRESLIKNTTLRAKENLYQIIMNMDIDDYRSVKKVMEGDQNIKSSFSMMFDQNIKMLEPIFVSNTIIEVTVQIPIYGEGSISSSFIDLYTPDAKSIKSKLDAGLSIRDTEYSRIIIDVRGMDFNTGIFPKIYYDKCNSVECELGLSQEYITEELYSPNLIPIEQRKTNYYIRYTSDPFKYKDEIWTGYKKENTRKEKMAFYISALRVEGENNTDVVIHQADAERLLVNYNNIETMLSGNIVILSD